MSQSSGPVESWFGERFCELHPLLQALHREGGLLTGVVQVEYGRGVAGWLGRRLARRMGLPRGGGTVPMAVRISDDGHCLLWSRRFADATFESRFEPVGQFGKGYWRERTGVVALVLDVQIIEGGWHWRHLRSSVAGLPLPAGLVRTAASKQIHEGRYRFGIAVSMPVLGRLLSYAGDLDLAPQPGEK